MSLQKLARIVKENGIEYVDLKLTDLLGTLHHLTIPVEGLDEKLFKWGVGVDGSSLPGFTRIESGDMILIPDHDTVFIDPFFEKPTLSMLGDIMETTDKILPYARNPRRIARDAEKYLQKIVKGATTVIGPEFEFYVFDHATFFQGPDQAYYNFQSDEVIWAHDEDREALGYKVPHKRGYHCAPPLDRTYNLRSQIVTMLKAVGVGLKYHHHEVGGGQHELEVKFQPLLKMGDQSILIKYFIKNECFRMGKSATFMPKPLFNEPGSGLHVHQYLADSKGASLFYDKNGPHKFSQLGLWYIGGMLKHVDSLLAFTNPSTNSFKRLVPGFEAPVTGTYSVGNRTACIRIPGYQRDPSAMRFEFRPGDGTMNPYLGFTAMLMAGLDGIKNKIDPGEALDRNIDKLPPEELAKIHQLPVSLARALDALETDHDYLLQGGVFTEDTLEAWIKLKRDEVTQIRIRPTPQEFAMYYDL